MLLVRSKVFLKVTEVLVENNKEQFTISDLVGKMQEYARVTGTLWRENGDHNCE